MALEVGKPSRAVLKWSMLSLLAVLVNPGGGATSPLSSQFKVRGLDTVRAGEAAFLHCHLEGTVSRPPSYVWVKDGKIVPGQGDAILRFKAVTREDAGLYQCGAPGSDVGGEGRHLYVVVPGGILPRPNIEHIGVPVCGRPFSLLCLITDRYIPSVNTVYTWYKDLTEVKGQTGPTLRFSNLTEADKGGYTCTAREGPVNTTSPSSHAHCLTSFVSPQVSMQTPSSESRVEGILGDNLTLACGVTRASPLVPHDGFSWSYLPSSGRKPRPLVGNRSTLTLGPLTWADRGQYFCQARNDKGFRDLSLTGQASVTVDVVDPASHSPSRHRRSRENASSLSDKFRVYGLDTVREGISTLLYCDLEGAVTLPSSYVWVKDGEVIPGQTEWNIRFLAVTREDAGLYQCGAPGSDVGGEGRYLYVVVLGDILPMPVVQYREVPVCGRPFSLHCIFMERYIPSVNTTYTWYKDRIVLKGQKGQELSFPNVTEADGGEYVCTGREGGWETTSPPSQAYYMVPLVSPQISIDWVFPDSTITTGTPFPSSLVKVFLGEKVTLICDVKRAVPPVPYDSFSWSYLPYAKGQLRLLVRKTRTLTLGPVTKGDRGQYFCQARNDQDNRNLNLTGQASVSVDVVYLDNITLTQDLKVQEDDPVTLACSVDSHPTARLLWTLDGQEVRYVTHNVDHYVILSAACSDSNTYTCAASNPDLPGLEISATVQVTVACKQGKPDPASTVLTTQAQSEEKDKWYFFLILPGLVSLHLAASCLVFI